MAKRVPRPYLPLDKPAMQIGNDGWPCLEFLKLKVSPLPIGRGLLERCLQEEHEVHYPSLRLFAEGRPDIALSDGMITLDVLRTVNLVNMKL